ncbi:hypothetical protein EN35_06075 [Rhodococcus qingshengii]|nr:hypothetical protein EN35_06075 [Rhodococcus qingshengii]
MRRIDVRIGSEQLFLRDCVLLEFGVALGCSSVARGEEHVLSALEALPQVVVGLARCAAGSLPLAEQIAEFPGGLSPFSGGRQLLGALDQFFLRRTGARTIPVEFGEVRSTSSVEGLASLGVPLPQRVVDLAVDSANRLPLVENLAQSITRGLPLGRLRADLLGLDCEGLLAGGACRARLFLLFLRVRCGLVGTGNDHVESASQSVEVTDYCSGREGFGQSDGGSLGLLASPAPDVSRASSSETSVARSS